MGKMTVNTAQRLILLLKLFEDGADISIRDIAARLEVTERTIWRDLSRLRELEIPIYRHRGLYRLDRGAWQDWLGRRLLALRGEKQKTA